MGITNLDADKIASSTMIVNPADVKLIKLFEKIFF